MVAGPLTIPPQPGFRPLGVGKGAPRGLRSLWAYVDAPDSTGLAVALAHLDTALAAAPHLLRALVQIDWRPLLTCPDAVAQVAVFAARNAPRVSTWVPLCHPGSPSFAALGAFATPPDCPGCVFYQGRACQGLGGEGAPFAALGGPPALRPVPDDLGAVTAADFASDTPLCYWRPSRAHLAQIGAAVRAEGGTLWDLGAGNGFLSALLAAGEGLRVRMVDRLSVYPVPAGVERVVADVRDPVLFEGERPAAVLISWPPGGDAFRDVVRRLRPRVLVLAYDEQGFCGARPAHAVARVSPAGLTWFTRGRDDFAPLPGLTRRSCVPVYCHADLRRVGAPPTGRLELRTATPPRDPVLASSPYPWE